MIYDIRHRTRFRYAYPVRFARCNVRLKPVDWAGQKLERHMLEITPDATIGATRAGAYLANITRIVIDRPASEIVIESRARLSVDRPMPESQADDPTVAEIAVMARASTDISAISPASYIFASPLFALFPEIAGWCAEELAPDRGIVEAGLALARRIH